VECQYVCVLYLAVYSARLTEALLLVGHQRVGILYLAVYSARLTEAPLSVEH
jgi:hypothetical protein